MYDSIGTTTILRAFDRSTLYYILYSYIFNKFPCYTELQFIPIIIRRGIYRCRLQYYIIHATIPYDNNIINDDHIILYHVQWSSQDFALGGADNLLHGEGLTRIPQKFDILNTDSLGL